MMLIRTMRAHVALVVSMLSACTSGSGGPQVSPSPPGITPTASASFVGLRSVVVSVSGIEGEAGGQLAGILFEGRETSYPGFHPLGGFAASVDADPYSATQIVREPEATPIAGEPFPFVTTAVLHVPTGTYTIALYVGPKLRPIPYSHWRPWGTPGLKGCRITFVVEDGKGSMTVRMRDPALAEWSGDHEDRWMPWHEHPPSCMRT